MREDTNEIENRKTIVITNEIYKIYDKFNKVNKSSASVTKKKDQRLQN
jgi:hypothetical protein